MKREQFDICWDDDCVEILDWIRELFKNKGFNKNFELDVVAREIDYDDDGEKCYIFK